MATSLNDCPRILTGITGSHAYGLATPTSDVDRKAVAVRPTVDYFGLFEVSKASESVTTTVAGGDDFEVHEVGKFLRLCLKVNPTVSEMLWLPGYEQLTAEGEELLGLRSSLLSAPAVRSSYLGYASAQLAGAERGKEDSRRAKYGRHLYRLAHQGMALWSTGVIEPRVQDRDEAFAFGERVSRGDLADAEALLAAMVECFNGPTVLPEAPGLAAVEDFVVRIRRAHLTV